MRIVLAGTFAGLGGVQIHLTSLAGELARQGHELLLLSFGKDSSPDDSGALDQLRHQDGVRLEFVGQKSAVSTLLAARRALRSFKPDIYFACGTGWNLFAAAILSRVPHLVFHEVMSGESCGWRDSRNLVRRFFHHVVAQAHPVAKDFARSFGWKEPIDVIPAYSQPLEQTPTAAKRSVPDGAARAAIFGRFVPHKRAAWLVEQWPRLKESLRELNIHGTGPEEPIIRELIAKNHWQNAVYLHGEYPRGQAYAELMASYDLTLLPTMGAEGAPLVLLESMACGIPFVATDVGGIRDYANPDCIVTDSTPAESFLDGVRTLTARLARGEIDQRRLQQFYQLHFSHDALAPRWTAFFDSLASS
jgi:glycosyltransferase involved in cell wall biosynthesis